MNNSTGNQGGDCWIAVTDQASRRILVFDSERKDWNSAEALKWSWSPSALNGFSDGPKGWGLPSDVKLRRNTAHGGESMIVCDSYGLAAIVPYPAGNARQWSQTIPGNLHAVELLPDGNIAIAASTGGWVRLYASSQGPDAEKHSHYDLPGAHGVLWDPQENLLWTIGDDWLVPLNVCGTASDPELAEDSDRKIRLPSRWGHDLYPVYGDADKLWVTTNSAVYQYSKSANTFLTNYAGADEINRMHVKGIGNQLSGQVVQTAPREGGLYAWTTDTVRSFSPNETFSVTNGAFYKARIWCAEYQ
ncbi:DUF6528 family protein [Paenibacillus allorhizosphaerae]|uniref:WD40 repeat domain-containing protein n=1 Tax=Paenibacillus allorhizosphaerae TaxID=2849866 RepID=A0ABN7TKY6_9BACL|nr:DUF6528 family protein [Paenibacillus allorhizosphaerae]CAG7644563.1 hypothetical protein PAECIP111802_03315 [Paenibacillus allorhizosphaerae]